MNREAARLTRRDFLRLSLLGGLVLAVPLVSRLPFPKQAKGSTKTIYAMGTAVTIEVQDELDPNSLDGAMSSAFGEVQRLEALLTHFDPSSQLSSLNVTGEIGGASDELVSVLSSSIRSSESTGGAFDATVQPALDLFSRFLGGGPLPSDSDFEAAQKLIDYQDVSISSHSIGFEKKGMEATLDGIATGYIIDSAVSALKASGVRSALVQAGGTIFALGAQADGSPWQIGVQDPLNPDGTVATLFLKDQAVATSGDYEDYYTPDKSYYHIVDPSDARSPLYSHSATVVAPTVMQADPLGVVLMVKSPADGVRLVEGLKDVECLVCPRSGGTVSSSGLPVSK